MRAILERSNLLKSLNHVHRVVERRNTIPILSNVLLRASGDTLTLKATDLDLEVLETVPAEIGRAGGTTVPAHMLYDIVRKLPDGSEVQLETAPDGQTLLVRSGRSSFALQMLPETDFPDLTTGEFPVRFQIAAPVFKSLIDRTQFAISTEETRYYLNGIYLHTPTIEGRTLLRAVATDGHRLARAQTAVPAGADGMPGIIIPRKTVGEIQKLLDGADAASTADIEISDTKIRVTFGSVVLTSKLIDGTFPDYARVIPQNNDKALKVDRATFSNAVDRVLTIASERGRAVKLSLAEDGRLSLTVNNPDSGSATEEIDVDYQQAPLDIGFNSRYLLDIAGQLKTATALFRFADPGSPTLIQDEGDDEALYVLMPMRV